MIEVNAGRAVVSGPMTLATATAMLADGIAQFGEVSVFDLAAVEEVDSAGLAILFGWLREAQRQGKSLRIENLPSSLSSLAEVYGVSDLLPVA